MDSKAEDSNSNDETFHSRLGQKTKTEFIRGQNLIMPSPVLPQFFPNFTNPNAFSMERSKHCSIDAR